MGLIGGANSHPKVVVTVDGEPVSGEFHEALNQLKITDKEGIRADKVEVTFADAPPHFASPRRGALVSVSLGYQGQADVFVGSFVIDRTEFGCLPYKIKVVGHSADLRAGMKGAKSRHWDDASVKAIVSQIAGEYDLDLRISDAVSSHVYAYIAQQDESDLNFMERLSRRHSALFSIKNGTLLWLEKGVGKSSNGDSIPTELIKRSAILTGSCRVIEADVDRFARVKAYWQDFDGGRRQSVVVDAHPDATGETELRETYSSAEEARIAADAAVKEMLRGSITTSCSIVGRPSLLSGQPIVYSGVRPGVDGREFILDEVSHVFLKSEGLRTNFNGKLKLPEE